MNQHDSAKYYFKKGKEYFDSGKYQDAIKCTNDALEIKRDYALALTTKAESLSYLGRIYEALYFVDKALKSHTREHDD